MSILAHIVIVIVAIAIIVVALFFLFKAIVALLFLFLRLLPTLIRAVVYWAIAVLFYFILRITCEAPALPGVVYLVVYLIVLGAIIVRRIIRKKPFDGASVGTYKGYILNKKSKVIHEKYSDSAATISPHHRKELSYSEARVLINNNKKYHFKD